MNPVEQPSTPSPDPTPIEDTHAYFKEVSFDESLSKMRRVVIHRPGGIDRMQIEESAAPLPASGEVLIKVGAAGINFADVIARMGLYEPAKKYIGWPITPGFEFAGQVLSVGDSVKDLKPGTEVFGLTRFGGYSSHVAVPRNQVWLKPERYTIEEAAAFPATHFTAYHALFQTFTLRPGMTALVHSAAGGVGTALLQLLNLTGCRSVGVVGAPHKVEIAKQYGATEVIDKSAENLWQRAEKLSPRGYDVILDANGTETLRQSFNHLAPVGKLICYGYHSFFSKNSGVNYLKLAWNYIRMPRINPFELSGQNKGVIGFNVAYMFDNPEMLRQAANDLLPWIDQGKIRAPEVRTFPMEQVGDAHRALHGGDTTGKLVLLP